jgi:DNA-directed RNA polymerase specialized sigma24 family protein
MKIYYIEDRNGKYASADGSRRFTRLEGTVAYDFLKSPQGKNRRFMKLVNTEGEEDEINIEVRSDVMKSFRTYERHEQYVADKARENLYTVISLSYAECDDEEYPEESLADEGINVEQEVFHQIDLEILRRALDSLIEEEYALICALYLQDKPMTEREYSVTSGIPQKTINDRKIRILKKLKSFF